MLINLKNPYLLSLLSVILLIVAWVIPNYPFTIFVAFAPLFYLIKDGSYQRGIFIVITLVITLIIVGGIENGYELILPFLISLAFIMYSFTHQVLKSRIDLFVIVIFILGFEYVLIKFGGHLNPVFVADNVPPEWSSWNLKTGYLGASAWILITNVIFCYILLTQEKTKRIVLVLVFLAIVIIPILFATSMNEQVVTRNDMFALYTREGILAPVYAKHGEVVARTCAWVSVLLLVFAVIKSKVKK